MSQDEGNAKKVEEKLHEERAYKFCRLLLQMNAYDIYYPDLMYVRTCVCYAAFRLKFEIPGTDGDRKTIRMKNCDKKSLSTRKFVHIKEG